MLKITKIGILTMIAAMISLLFGGCSDGNVNGNNPPSLQYMGINKDTMVQGFGGINSGDSIVVFLNFQDIDGDIVGGQSSMNISIVDNRDGFVDPVSFPVLPKLKDGQKGELKLSIFNTCCQFPEGLGAGCIVVPGIPSNRFTYDIFIEDGAGNISNRITTDSITLLCQ
jgi:hypothetical protein